MTKCACAMTALELLQANIAVQRPVKSVLITDRGRGWDVVMYGPDSAGFPPPDDEPAHITIQSALEKIEECLVHLRRQPDVGAAPRGEIVTDPHEIARALKGK